MNAIQKTRNELTSEEYHNEVVSRLDEDILAVENFDLDIRDLGRRGFTISDTVSFIKLTEEYNPDLDEDTALAKMKVITDRNLSYHKYK